jgi:hypothetical protein
MAYIGKTPITGNFVKLDAISVVNGQAAYTMNNGGSAFTDYENVNQFLVSLNGILQSPTTSFTVSSSTITFASNLQTGDSIDFIIVLGNTLDIGTPSDSTVSLAKLTATGTKDATTFLRGDNSFAVPSGGKIGQVLQTVKTDVFQTSSSSFTDVTGLSVSITPSATSSKILCICTGIYGKTTSDNFHHQLVRDSTSLLANTLDPGTDTNQTEVFSVQFLDSPSSTSALTYKLQIKNDGTSPVNINRNGSNSNDRGDSTITVIEVLA